MRTLPFIVLLSGVYSNLTYGTNPNIFIQALSLSSTSSTSSTSSASSTSSLSQILLPHVNSYAATHSLLIQSRNEKDNASKLSFETAPISLLPNAFPRASFERAQTLAPLFNSMVDVMSRDLDFLTQTLQHVAEVDPFTGKLLKMYIQLYGNDSISCSEGNFAKMADSLGILRSDYMLNSKNDEDNDDFYQLQQIELNTIASSFAGLATNVASLHRHLIERLINHDEQNEPSKEMSLFLKKNVEAIQENASDDERLNEVPYNPALENLPKAMQLAHKRYISNFEPSKKPIIAFIVQPNETNTIDQRLLEFQLWQKYQIPVVRLSLQEISKRTIFKSETGALHLNNDSQQEISLIYFRAGYAPTDYPTESCWEGREILEKSRATKCPNLGYHLSGTKKVQQQLARPGVVERFSIVPNSTSIRTAFAGLHSLAQEDMEDSDYDAIKRILLQNKEEEYVLKPQREGGGYNFYGKDLAQKLREGITIGQDKNDVKNTMTVSNELAEFILMERIFPPHQNAILLRSGSIEGEGPSVSELGCYGCILSTNKGEVLHNEYAGYLLRTKFVGVNEGGVASGFATLSSPYLC